MKRTVMNLQQGTNEWLVARAASDGTASEAPAMKAKSKYQSRTDLLNQRKTGLAKEVDSATQVIFNKGHEAEAKARVIAEEIIGEELSPVTCMVEVEGLKLMASLDGITFSDEIIWEHKLWNESLAQQVLSGELEEHYTIQMDQELLASGAKKCLFMTSDGTRDKCASMWYESSSEKFGALIAGWKQFHQDLADHVPPVIVEKVEAETVQTLPVPSVVVRGEITASNLMEITPKFDAYLAGIKTELSTDQDFADAEANAKNCRETAKRIEALQENIIAQMVSVNEVNSTLDSYKAAFNKVGLQLEKAVKDQKEMLKMAAIMKAKTEYSDFVNNLNENCAVLLHRHLAAPDFAAVIKGVKTITSMQSRINDALASGKTEATTFANEVKAKLEFISASITGYEHLINVPELATKDLDYIKLHIQSVKDAEDKRKAEHEAAIKAKAESEARAKLEREAQAEADAKAKLEAEAAAEVKAKAEANAADAKQAAAEQIASADKPIPDGDAITNAFVDSVNTGTGALSVSVNEQSEVTTSHVSLAKATGKRPTAQAIINLVATTYKVDSSTAQRWLEQSFGELKAA